MRTTPGSALGRSPTGARTGVPTGTPAGIRSPPDAATPVVIYLCLLFGMPSGLVFAPLGAAGSPAALLGTGFLGWWVVARLVPGLGVRRGPYPQPIRIGLYAFQLSAAASYLAGALRPMTAPEASSSTRGLLTVCAWSGVVLVTADGLATRANLDRVLKALVGGGVFLATLGIIQFFSGWNPATLIKVPGLSMNQTFGSNFVRDNFTRVQGTAAHAIEFGVVLAMVLPLALHYACFATDRKAWRWTGVLLIGFALPMTVSRSAVVGLAIVMTVMFIAWPGKRRRQFLIAAPFLTVGLKLLIPGLLGALRKLFFNIAADSSTQGRTDDYGAVGYYVSHSPFFGRGISTFIPELYRTLDNAYLGWLLEAGIVGLIVLIGVLLTAILTALLVRTRAKDDPRTRDLGAALTAGLLSVAFNFATFDALGFAICAGVFFLLLGATGALWRLTTDERRDELRPSAVAPRELTPSWSARAEPGPRTWFAGPAQLATAAIGMLLVLIPGVVHSDYIALGSVLLEGPGQHNSGSNLYAWSPYLDLPSEIAQRLVMSPVAASDLRAHGFGTDYTVAAGIGSLMPRTDRTGRGSLIRIQVQATTAAHAVADRDAVIRELQQRFAAAQLAAGSPPTELIQAVALASSDPPAQVTGNRKHALVTAGGLGFAFGGIGLHLAGRWRQRQNRQRQQNRQLRKRRRRLDG